MLSSPALSKLERKSIRPPALSSGAFSLQKNNINNPIVLIYKLFIGII
jgi:hypothetical protein